MHENRVLLTHTEGKGKVIGGLIPVLGKDGTQTLPSKEQAHVSVLAHRHVGKFMNIIHPKTII